MPAKKRARIDGAEAGPALTAATPADEATLELEDESELGFDYDDISDDIDDVDEDLADHAEDDADDAFIDTDDVASVSSAGALSNQQSAQQETSKKRGRGRPKQSSAEGDEFAFESVVSTRRTRQAAGDEELLSLPQGRGRRELTAEEREQKLQKRRQQRDAQRDNELEAFRQQKSKFATRRTRAPVANDAPKAKKNKQKEKDDGASAEDPAAYKLKDAQGRPMVRVVSSATGSSLIIPSDMTFDQLIRMEIEQ